MILPLHFIPNPYFWKTLLILLPLQYANFSNNSQEMAFFILNCHKLKTFDPSRQATFI